MTGHGKASRYQDGCRCEPCREANRVLTRRCRLRRNGWSEEDYQAAWTRQRGLCAICGRAEKRSHPLAADHDHDTGMARGLLCSHCNRVIGMFGDDASWLRSAATYLDQYGPPRRDNIAGVGPMVPAAGLERDRLLSAQLEQYQRESR